MQRDLNGPQKKKTKYHLIVLLCFLIIVYGFGSAYEAPDDNDGKNNADGDGNSQTVTLTLTLGQIVLIGVWVFVAIFVTAIFGKSKFILLLYWLLVYWPLLAVLATTLVSEILGSDTVWIGYMLIVVEIMTVVVFVCVNYAYPRLVTSNWFRHKYARWFWNIKLLDDGLTMEYDGIWGRFSRRRYECRYVGELNEKGLPHGRGVWADDSYNGEVLTGMWDEGHPIAPFHSRQYGGKGNTFSAVKIAYFMANDDNVDSNKFMPTNDDPPRCGLASVECSVAGDFMSHLPCTTLIGDPRVEGEGDFTIGKLCKQLSSTSNHMTSTTSLEEEDDDALTSLQIRTDDPRGVQIDGHLYESTGLPFTKRIKQIVVDVIQSDTSDAKYDVLNENAVDEENGVNNPEEGDEEEGTPATTTSTLLSSSDYNAGASSLRLKVHNWTSIGTKDALIFIPGFNSWLTHSLETFGQMVAMTKLSQRVFPVLFAWPGGQVLTYRYSSLISASENNRRYFLQMLKSLKEEGITNIHIVTHSKGVETLMNCFEDNSDGSPSEVSQFFGPAPTSRANDYSRSSIADMGKLVCRSITMLNPDYPTNAFTEHGFQTLRRVASLITVVGDKTDQALFWSSFINGIVNTVGWTQPSALDFEGRAEKKGLQAALGKNIDQLYVNGDKDNLACEDVVTFQYKANTPNTRGGEGYEAAHKVWLDVDVIDTTGLDTNVNDLRHSAYSVNSILLRDIEELVVTGKRASERTTLLHKSGNVFEYCHAPSFVSL